MGMFDELKYNDEEFQTKDLNNAMCSYKIEDEKLYIERRTIHEINKSKKNSKMPRFKFTHEGWDYIEYHGIINVYNNNKDIYLKFTDGILISEMTQDQIRINDDVR